MTVICDEMLLEQTAQYAVDVFVFDDHFQRATQVEPGEFVRFTNLHAAKYTVRDPLGLYTAVLGSHCVLCEFIPYTR